MNQLNSDKVVLSSGAFIVFMMIADALLSDEIDTLPRQAMMGLLLVTLLSSLSFVGLSRIAGPFAALIAGTVFFTRGDNIFRKLTDLSKTGNETTGELHMMPFSVVDNQ